MDDEYEEHEIWMALNCGVPDGGCTCRDNPRPESGYLSMTFAEIAVELGEHLDEVLKP